MLSEHSLIFHVIYAITLPQWGEIRLVCMYIVHRMFSDHLCFLHVHVWYMHARVVYMHVHVLNIHVHACMLTFIGVTCYSISIKLNNVCMFL